MIILYPSVRIFGRSSAQCGYSLLFPHPNHSCAAGRVPGKFASQEVKHVPQTQTCPRSGATVVTAAYLTKLEIIRALRLPEKVGRAKFAMWQLDPTFPKPEPVTANRRFWPLVEKWLRQHHGVDTTGIIPVPDGRENFDAWRERRKAGKASKAKGPGDARPGLPPAPVRMAPNVVATIGPGGKRPCEGDAPPLAAVGREPTSA
jgi:hypothetical protein